MSEIVEKLAEAVVLRDYDAADDVWLELLEAESVPADELAPLLERLVTVGQAERAVDMVLALAPELIRAERHAEALPLLRAVALTTKANEDVRAGLIDCYRRVYRSKRHAAACIDRCGILAAPELAEPVRTLERMLSYEEGDYVYHPSGWGVGQIVGFHPLDVTATIDFEQKPGHIVPLDTLETIFVRLELDDFRVLRKIEPEGLRQLAEDDPAALVRKLLAATDGRATLRGLREALQGDTVPANGWSKWWTRARAALRRDAHVDVTSGSSPVLTLRAEALTHEDKVQAQFDRCVDLAHKTGLVRDYARHMASDADPDAFLIPACQALAERLRGSDPAGARFEAALLLTRLDVDAGEFPTPEAILAEQADPVAMLNGLTTTPARRRAAELLREQAAGDWKQTCRRILLDGPVELWDAAVTCLADGDEPPTVQGLLDELRENPKLNLDLFAWLGRGLLSGRLKAEADPKVVFEQLLTEGDALARQKTERRPSEAPFGQTETLNSLRHALRAGDLGYFDAILAEANEREASRLLFRIRQSSVLTELVAYQLERKTIRKFPRLLAEEQKAAETAEPEYLYATPEGIARRRAEHEHLLNVAIPANEKRIREAAAMGDISDSADWRTAIEEQGRLSQRALEMADELGRARPIEPSMVHADHVSIGSKVAIENTATGEQVTYLLLGVWDADAEHCIMSYMAPLARALMTHKAGEEVTLEHAGETTVYRILSIESALAPEGGTA